MFLPLVCVVCHGTRNKGLIVEFWCFFKPYISYKTSLLRSRETATSVLTSPSSRRGDQRQHQVQEQGGLAPVQPLEEGEQSQRHHQKLKHARPPFLALTPSTTPGSPPICPPALKSRSLSPIIYAPVTKWSYLTYSLDTLWCFATLLRGQSQDATWTYIIPLMDTVVINCSFFCKLWFPSISLPAATWYWKSGI